MGGSRPENDIDDKSVKAQTEQRLDEVAAKDPRILDAKPLESVHATLQQPGIGLARTVATIMESYADRPALGERAKELTKDPDTGRSAYRLLPEFETITYRELWSRVQAVSAEWQHGSLRAGDFVCLLGFTSTDYATLDLACVHSGAVSVPLQSSAPVSQLQPIVQETGPRIIATSVELLGKAVELAISSELQPRVIVFDHHPEVDEEREKFEAGARRLAESGIAAEALGTVLERGAEIPTPAPFVAESEDSLSLLIYTSGSTGTPKGAMYPEWLVRRVWAGFLPKVSNVPSITISYLPMSHLAGRASLVSSLAHGGTTYFTAKSDLSTFFADIALSGPTELMLVPRICDMLFQQYQSELDRRAADFGDQEQLDAAVKQDLRENFLGGRVVHAMCGSAPISTGMHEFVESCLGLPLNDGYGSTEAGGVLINTHVQRPPVTEYKLVDVPELGYFRTDSPHPRGELLLKADSLFPGYFNRPEVTAEVFDADGFYKTGDIMAEIGPDRLAYVDRRKNVLKLSQGEFVAVSHLESVFATSPLVKQIFVYGSSVRAYLLAVIVPTDDALERNGNTEALKARIGESLQQVANEAELNSYEIPRDFLIETEPFTNENGLLSDARKLLRPKLTDRYGEQLEQLYAQLAEGQASELRTLRRTGRDKPVLETVSRAAQALLGCAGSDVGPEAHFTDLGGDSLSALSFSKLLQEIFDVEVPVGVVISPANDLRGIARHIEGERSSGAKRPTFATVHGRESTQVRAGDLALDKFIAAQTLDTAETLPRPDDTAPQTVLLTGANGYLGRFLCLDWLERLGERGGKLICIVRGADSAAARKRLDEAFDSGDPELLRHYRALAADHLEVLAGDIGEPDLGLDEPTWNRLATDVDLIVHPAALVNHVLPYGQLFGPNVVGTAELIRMALTTRIKPITYLSTVGVAAGVDPSALDEDADIRVTSPVRELDETYANGYATSKWAGEVLLREAHAQFGLPAAVFRSDMILAHSRYTGQLNVPDMFTRLLLSLVATGIAPRSFYRTGADGARPRAHYDGLPADFTAEAITELGARNTAGYQTFNVLNPHDDGISLDVFVDWLNEAGHSIQRIDDFDDWIGRFETAVRAMPETQRQHSLLPLLHAFQQPDEPVPGSGIPAERFHEAVRAAGIGADEDIPHLSASLIGKYVTDLQQLGLL